MQSWELMEHFNKPRFRNLVYKKIRKKQILIMLFTQLNKIYVFYCLGYITLRMLIEHLIKIPSLNILLTKEKLLNFGVEGRLKSNNKQWIVMW